VLAEGSHVSGAEHAWRRVFIDTDRGWLAHEFLFAIDEDVWSCDLGLACSRENYWDADGQPKRRAAMEQFNKLSLERRKAIFESSMDAGLDAEGITDADVRKRWKRAMRPISLGEAFRASAPTSTHSYLLAKWGAGPTR
jgi:hypothetical protein